MKTNSVKFILMILGLLLSLPGLAGTSAGLGEPAEAQEVPGSREVMEKPKIDGILDDEAWKTPPLKKEFITYLPVYGEKLPYETWVWTANDNNTLYFAFLCFDPEPKTIQTSFTKRDNIDNDDWAAVCIDAAGNNQTSYVLYVNPSGIQGDALVTAVGDEDLSPDFVWESAGRITEQGYQVEIALPLKSLRFKSGEDVKLGLLFKRKVTRLGSRASWPEIPLGHTILDSQVKVRFKNLKNQFRLEILPAFTLVSNREKVNSTAWDRKETAAAVGLSIKYGITSAITADITVNPDFSQVESDAFQVEVNQRYPLFFSEKRPFFMEGADIFKFYTYSDGFFKVPVHMRQIVEPAWGAKITGDLGNMSFGLLSAGDDWPGQPLESTANPDEGKSALFGIARGKYSLGKDNYVGLLYSGRDFAGQYNRVLGADCVYRLGQYHRFSGSFLYSFSRDPHREENQSTNGSNANFEYNYEAKQLYLAAAYEHIDPNFRMDTAYLLRNGIDNYSFLAGFAFYPNPQKNPWLKMIIPEITWQYTHDLFTHHDDRFFNAALYCFTAREGELIINYSYITEYWQEEFNLKQLGIEAGIRLSNWLKVGGNYSYGERIYYEGDPVFKGRGHLGSLFLDLQPSEKFNQYFSFTHSDLSRGKDSVYNVDIIYTRTTYHLNRYFFLRAVLQYNSYDKRLLTDFLASFTLIPGTVVHVGYGGLYESRTWEDNRWRYGEGRMLNSKRSFFAKVSYLWRF
jgi:hypothetical protein